MGRGGWLQVCRLWQSVWTLLPTSEEKSKWAFMQGNSDQGQFFTESGLLGSP